MQPVEKVISKFAMVFMAVGFILSLPHLALSQIIFQPYQSIQNSTFNEVVAIGDLNNDGYNDVAFAESIHLFVCYQSRNGGLSVPVLHSYTNNSSTTSMYVQAIEIADVNNDSLQDLVFGFRDSIGISYQNSLGVLNPAIKYHSGNGVDAIKSADINHDGLEDIAVAHWNSSFFKIFYQAIGGGFSTATYNRPGPTGWDDIDIGDLDNDGDGDIIVMSGQLTGRILIYFQSANGFSPLYLPFNFSAWDDNLSTFSAIAIGDLNNDGRNDVAATKDGNQPDSKVLIWYFNATAGNFSNPVEYDAYDSPSAIEIADLNCDGDNEIIIEHDGWSAVTVYEKNISGQYDTYSLHAIWDGNYHPESMAIGDVDNDARVDIAVASMYQLSILINSSAMGSSFLTDTLLDCDTPMVSSQIFTDTISVQQLDTVESTVIAITKMYETSHAVKVSDELCDVIVTKAGCGSTTVPDTTQISILDTLSLSRDSTLLSSTLDTLLLGAHVVSHSDEISAFPNPVYDILVIQIEKTAFLNNHSSMQIINAGGMEIYSAENLAACNKINFENYPEGVYFIKLILGKSCTIRKIVKLRKGILRE